MSDTAKRSSPPPFPVVTRHLLAQLKVGERRVISETPSQGASKNAGKSCTSYALRAGIRVTTHKCYVVVPGKGSPPLEGASSDQLGFTRGQLLEGVLVERVE